MHEQRRDVSSSTNSFYFHAVNIVALGLANLFGGLFVIVHNVSFSVFFLILVCLIIIYTKAKHYFRIQLYIYISNTAFLLHSTAFWSSKGETRNKRWNGSRTDQSILGTTWQTEKFPATCDSGSDIISDFRLITAGYLRVFF